MASDPDVETALGKLTLLDKIKLFGDWYANQCPRVMKMFTFILEVVDHGTHFLEPSVPSNKLSDGKLLGGVHGFIHIFLIRS